MFLKYLNFLWDRRIDNIIVDIKGLRPITSVAIVQTGILVFHWGAGTDDMVLYQRVELVVLETGSNTLHVLGDVDLFMDHLEIEARQSVNYYEGSGLRG